MSIVRSTSCLAALLAVLSPAAQAAATFTTDFAAFNAANPGLAVETFEAANVPSGQDRVFDGPLNAATNTAEFAAGSVLGGFSISTTAGDIYAARDFGGNPGATISSNLFGENLNIGFAPGVTAIGIDLLQWQGHNDGWRLEAFDAANVSLGSFGTNGGSFVGLVSDVAVARLFLDKPDSGAVIDNLRFGAAQVPEPSPLALLALAGLGLAWRRRAAYTAAACRPTLPAAGC
ncbi:MAG: PEP-CTERM sorting domain-containing protein [Rubrivivax sp.]|nr:PEP-CTERM sorting domain-containing protein [Rubrivivax sp.]